MRKKNCKRSVVFCTALACSLAINNSVFAAGSEPVQVGRGEELEVESASNITSEQAGVNAVTVKNGGQLSFGDEVNVNATENNSYGIYIENDVTSNDRINFTAGNGLTINTYGDSSVGLYVKSYPYSGPNTPGPGALVNIGDGLVITTQGNYSTGIKVRDNTSVVTIGNGLELQTSGRNAHGIYAEQQGIINVQDDASILTEGNSSHGIFAEVSKSVVTLGEEAKITTTGNSSYAVNAAFAGSVKLGAHSSIHTLGSNSFGLHVSNDTRAQETFFVAGDDLSILTEGNGAYGVYVNGDGKASNGERNSFARLGENTFIKTTGESSTGVLVTYKSNFSSGKSIIVTQGSRSIGLDVYSGGQARLGSGSGVYTSGERSHGIYAFYTNSQIEMGSNSAVATTGNNAKAVYALSGGSIQMGDNGKIFTAGDNSNALHAGKDRGGVEPEENSAVMLGDGAVISTSGRYSHAIYAADEATVVIGDNAQIFTQGEESSAVYLENAGTSVMLGNSSLLKTTGMKSHAVHITEGAELALAGEHVIIADANKRSHALFVEGKADSSEISKLSASGKLYVEGSVLALGNSVIHLDFAQGSVFKGFANAKGDNAQVNISMDKSFWEVTDDPFNRSIFSTYLNNLHLQDSIIDLSGLSAGNIFSIQSLTGNNGTFILSSSVADSQSGVVMVNEQASGNHYLVVKDSGSSATTGEEVVKVAYAEGDGVDFKLHESVDAGGFSYYLRESLTDKNAWELYSRGEASKGGSASINNFIGAYLLNDAETQTLMQRMGELRSRPSEVGLWARTYGGKYRAGSNQLLSGFDMKYSGAQIGMDKMVQLKNNDSLYWGGMFAYSQGKMSYPTGKGEIDGKTLGIYGTYLDEKGFYADLVLKHMWMKQDFNVLDNTYEAVKGEHIRTGGFGTSLEFGKRFALSQAKTGNWYVQPQAQLSYARQGGGSFTASNGLQVDVNAFTSLQGRLGVIAGYELKNSANPQNIYFKVSRHKEFNGELSARFNGTPVETSFKSSWWTYGVGYALQTARNQHIYLDLERSGGGPFTKPWAINVGFRVNF